MMNYNKSAVPIPDLVLEDVFSYNMDETTVGDLVVANPVLNGAGGGSPACEKV